MEFLYEGRQHEADYDREGNWMATETEISYTELPESIIEHIQEAYHEWEIDDVEIVKKSGAKKYYEIELVQDEKEMILFYTMKGVLEKTETIVRTVTVVRSDSIPEDVYREEDSAHAGYALTRPDVTMEMPVELLEISGVEIIDDATIACVQDEKGIVYLYDTIEKRISRTIHFGNIGDYEDIAYDGGNLYVLRSDARLYTIGNFLTDNLSVGTQHFVIGCLNNEGLFHGAGGRLIIASKSRLVKDSNADNRYLFVFEKTGGGFGEKQRIKLDPDAIREKLPAGIKKIKFNPSAVAIHPLTGELYVLSANDRLLVVCDEDGGIVSATVLDPKLYFQPEGLAFFRNGDMLISNEGKKKTNNPPGNILLFRYSGGEE
ncbi:MAG: PepSY-like domain-containing protein [Spirochaetales bacterium]|nr:PepSY-like domain-containing protein [Spirochaetales bacterium]